MAREGYLVHAGEDTIHDPEAEKKAEQAGKTPHGKWENFWFYHKWHVVIGIAVAAVVIGTVVSTVKTVQPDYTVGLITRNSYPEEVTNQLGQTMAKYGVDRNGDGKVVVQVASYVVTPQSASSAGSGSSSGSGTAGQADPQMEMAYRTKLMADVSTGTSMIFVTDDASFLAQEKAGDHIFAYTDGSTPKDSAADYDKMRVSLSKCPKLANLRITYQTTNGSANMKLTDVLKDGSVSLRIYKGSAIEGKQDDYYKASKALFQKLIS